MGKGVTILTAALVFLSYGSPVSSEVYIEPLRGTTAINALSPAPQPGHMELDRTLAPRNFIQQPPLIPHTTRGYSINLKSNKCLSCHSWANYQAAGATKISQQHFKDRDGNYLADVSALRYFCTQCHVGQFNASPPVGNDFEPVTVLRDR